MDAPQLLRLLAPLAVIVAALLLTRRWVARSQAANPSGLRVQGRAGLTRDSTVAVVHVDGRRFLVGAANGTVNVLAELDPDPAPAGAEGFGPPTPLPRTAPVVERLRRLTVRGPVVLLLALVLAAALGEVAWAQDPSPIPTPVAPSAPPTLVPAPPAVPGVPDIGIDIGAGDETLSRSVTIVLLLTIGSVAPGVLLLMTTFTRFVIVLGLVKNALALQTIPPAQVLVGLALFLTFFAMGPVFREANTNGLQPLLAGQLAQDQAFDAAYDPFRRFMLAQTRPQDLELFLDLANEEPASPAEVSATTLIPAFVISELRTAFITGFVIFIPFVVIDLVVATVLMSLGMMMLPPVFISLPLKLLLFVLVDGWVLIVGSLIGSVQAFT